jgi:hypothetical protein
MPPQVPVPGTEPHSAHGALAPERAGVSEGRLAAPRASAVRRVGTAEQRPRTTPSELDLLDLLRRPQPSPGADGAVADRPAPVVLTRPAPSPYGTLAHPAGASDPADEAEPRLTARHLALLGVALYFAALAAVHAHHRYREAQVINVPAPVDERNVIA